MEKPPETLETPEPDKDVQLNLTWAEFLEIWTMLANRVLGGDYPEPGTPYDSFCAKIRAVVDARY